MATGGDSWTQIFSKWNSGTYNNQVSRMVMAMMILMTMMMGMLIIIKMIFS